MSPHSEESLNQAEENLARCLEALDQRGEEGLQDELDRIFPGSERPPKSGYAGIIHYTEHPSDVVIRTVPYSPDMEP